MSGVPYLAAENDTRINLLMRAAGMRNLPVVLSPLPQEISRSRGYIFGVFPGEAVPETAPGQTVAPQDNPFDAQALSLGIKPSGLTGFSAENEGRWISNNPWSLSEFFQALLDDLPALLKLQTPFKIGLVQQGDWHSEWQQRLATSPYYRGEVVFLLNTSL